MRYEKQIRTMTRPSLACGRSLFSITAQSRVSGLSGGKFLLKKPSRPLLTAAWEQPESRAAFVAKAEGKVLGFVYAELKEGGHCPANINALFVQADGRSRGAGQALLDAALDWCRSHAASEVSLDCIWPNDLARRFYEKRGFQPLLVTYVLTSER